MYSIKNLFSILIILSMGLFFAQCDRTEGPVQPISEVISKVPNLDLIDGAEDVAAKVNDNRVTSYFTYELNNIKPNPFIGNGAYEGWCTLWDIPIQRGNEYSGVKLYSTRREAKWNKLNYLMYKKDHYLENIDGATWKEIQIAIWSLIEFYEFDLNKLDIQDLPSEFREGNQYAFSMELVNYVLKDIEQNADSKVQEYESGYVIFMQTDSDVQNGLIYIDPVKLITPLNESSDVTVDPLLEWTESKNADFYWLQVSKGSDLNDPIVDEDDLTDTYKQLNGLDFETTYFWRVKAVKADTSSPWSSVWSFTTESEAPDQYTLTVNVVGEGSVEVDGTAYTSPVTVDEGTTLSLEAIAASGWEFSAWSGALTGTTNPDDILMDGNKSVTATFTEEEVPPVQYTLTVNIVGDGSVEVDGVAYTSPVTVNEGTTLSLEAIAAAGWEFSAWSGALTGTTNPDDILMDGNKSVTATFTEEEVPPVQYTLTVNVVGDGSVEVDGVAYTSPVTVNEGTTLSLEAIAAAGWEFSAWSGALTGTTNPDDILMDGNKSVTATFTEEEVPPVQYTLTVNVVGDGSVEVDGVAYTSPVTVNEGTTLSLEAIAAAGWEFSAWSGDLTGTTNPDDIVLDGNKTVTATFTEEEIPPIQYTLTVNVVGDGSVEVDGAAYTSPVTVDEGTTLSLEAIAAAGWEFSAWSGALTGTTNPDDIVMDGNKSVTATFTEEEVPPVQYTLTVNVVGDGTVEVEGAAYTSPVTVDEGTTLSLEAIAASGWEFSAWSGDLTGTTNPDNILMDGNKSVTVTFTEEEVPPVQYTLTVNVVGDGSVEVDGAAYTSPVTVDEGTTLSLEAIAASGWEFSAWSGDLTGTTNPDNILMDGDKSVTATFTEEEVPPVQYTLTVNVVGDGSVEVDGAAYTSPVTVDEGTTLSLEAIAASGWEFSAWSGALTGTTNPDNLLMDGNKTVTATFTEIPPDQYTLTVNIVGSGSVEVDGTAYTSPVTVDEGTTLSLEAIAATGWEFSAWSGTLTGTTNPDNLLMDGNKTVTATFTEIPPVQYTLTVNVVGEGSVEVDGVAYTSPVSVDEGTTLSLEAIAAAGWEFSAWSGALTGTTNPDDILMDGNKSVTATFTEEEVVQFSIPINVSDGQFSQSLTIGLHPDGALSFVSGLDQYAPPAPPAGAFDAALLVQGERYLTKMLSNTLTQKQFPIMSQLAAGQTNITITWNNNGLSDLFSFTITDGVTSVDMKNNTNYVPSNNLITGEPNPVAIIMNPF
jgi:uncharacterized repeat protein (TIGR02543 family)